MFKRPVQRALQLRLRLGGTDVRDSAARFRDRLFRGNQEVPAASSQADFVGMAAAPSFLFKQPSNARSMVSE
jgi:hypothetical protein